MTAEIKSKDILVALTRSGGPFCYRRWVAVPRVYWGWGLNYEADLIAISKAGNCTEIEIKISRQDLRADRAKRKWLTGLGPMIHKFYYAVPEKLEDYARDMIPESAGLISVGFGKPGNMDSIRAKIIKIAKPMTSRKPTPSEILKLHHLGIMRYWDLFLREQK